MDLDAFESRLNQLEGAIYGAAPPERLALRLSNIVDSYHANSAATNDMHSLLNTFSTLISNKRTSIEQLTHRLTELIHDKSHIEQLVRSVEIILAHEHVVHADYDISVVKFKDEIESLNEEMSEVKEQVTRQSEALDWLLQNYESAMEVTSNLFIKWEIDLQKIQSNSS